MLEADVNLRLTPNSADLDVMARTIFGEARGEPREGQVAVAWTIINRWQSGRWFATPSIAGTCMKRLQYSCWNHDDPTYDRVNTVKADELTPFFAIANDVINGIVPDPTGGATHYYADTIPTPKWARGKTPTVKIGHHAFFSNID